MAVYDDEKEKQFEPNELKQREDELGDDDGASSYNNEEGTEDSVQGGDSGEDSQSAEQLKEAEESAGLQDQLGGALKRAQEADAGWETNVSGEQKKPKGRLATLASSRSRQALIAGVAGGGIVGVITVLFGLFGFLNIFRLEHLLKNIDGFTQTRLEASIDARNDHLVREYIRLRLADNDGSVDGSKNLFFRANKVDTNNPIRDWYTTLRTSKFEEEVFNQQGIFFTGVVKPDGTVGTGKLKIKDTTVDFDVKARYNIDPSDLTPTKINAIANRMDAGDFDKLFEQEIYPSHKDARRALKTAVNDNTHWWQVMKRRHVRRDISNMTGIKSWRLFEKTRDKLAKTQQQLKDQVLNKIISKYYANNPSTALFLKCLFSNSPCSPSDDPASPDNKTESIATGEDAVDKNGDTQTQDSGKVDKNGKPIPENKDLNTGATGREIDTTLTNEIEKAASGQTDEALAGLTPEQKMIQGLVQTIVGDTVQIGESSVNPLKLWTWAKRLTKIDGLLRVTGGDSKLSKMVKNARRAQLAGIYATYAIANSQMKSGELVGDEVGTLMGSLKNVGNTEAWSMISGGHKASAVSAETIVDTDKAIYCSPDHNKTDDEFAFFCNSQKPNNGGNASSISSLYTSTIGRFVLPIANVVNAFRKTIVGTVFTWASTFTDSVLGHIIDPIIVGFLGATGLDKTLQSFMGGVMFKLLQFLGAAPMFDGTKPGAANLIAAGSAATAESTLRASGGVISTPDSLEHTNSLVNSFNRDQSGGGVFDRYASLDNPNSLVSRSLFAATDHGINQSFTSAVGSLFTSLPKAFASAVNGRASAAGEPLGPSDMAAWAGVDTYDIPEQCIDYDSFTATPNNGTNFYGMSGINLDWATVRDTDKFYQKVYDWAGTDTHRLELAKTVYNCNLFNARVMGGLGALYGYEQDGGIQ